MQHHVVGKKQPHPLVFVARVGSVGRFRVGDGMKTHPQVVVTHGWFLEPASCVGWSRNPPMSHKDSLVLLEMG